MQLLLVQTHRKIKEVRCMDMSRDKDQKGTGSTYMEMSGDNDQRQCVY